MVKLPTQKRYAILPIVAGSILWTIFVVMPILNYLQSLVDFYEPILNETTPTIHLYDGRIEFQGSIPQKITLANDVEVFFDSTFNDSAFQQSPVRSVFISSQTIHVKTKNETKTYSLDDIEVDSEPLVLEPLQVKEILRKYRDIAFVIISITGFFCRARRLYAHRLVRRRHWHYGRCIFQRAISIRSIAQPVESFFARCIIGLDYFRI
mgnify:CR=1 FL=1